MLSSNSSIFAVFDYCSLKRTQSTTFCVCVICQIIFRVWHNSCRCFWAWIGDTIVYFWRKTCRDIVHRHSLVHEVTSENFFSVWRLFIWQKRQELNLTQLCWCQLWYAESWCRFSSSWVSWDDPLIVLDYACTCSSSLEYVYSDRALGAWEGRIQLGHTYFV